MKQLSSVHNSSRGFTLLELLVVVGLVAVVSAIAVAALSQVRQNATIAAAAQFSKSIESALAGDFESEVVGMWDMADETGGVVVDTARGNDLLFQGNSSWSNDTPLSTGVSVSCATSSNQCLFISGTKLANQTALENDASSDLTITTWFKVDALPLSRFVNIVKIGANSISVRLLPDGSLQALYPAAGVDVRASKIKAGRWYHIVFSYNDTSARLYVNGQLEDEDESVNNVSVGSPHVYVGGGGSYGLGMKVWNPRFFRSTAFLSS